MRSRLPVFAAALSLLSAPAMASTVLVSVSGGSNPNLAGAGPTTICCSGDSVPAQSPLLAPITFAPGSTFIFAVAGVTDGAGTGPTGPDGSYAFDMVDYGLGVAPASGVGVLGLVGVFLDNSTLSGATEPAGLDFSSGLNFAALSPGLAQIFWIGDGLTGTGTGASQVFTAPSGATRLFLGTVDGFSWNDNSGAYAVTLNYQGAITAVPEPATWAMMLIGFGLIGATARRRIALPTA
jgi:hypothetical protein